MKTKKSLMFFFNKIADYKIIKFKYWGTKERSWAGSNGSEIQGEPLTG